MQGFVVVEPSHFIRASTLDPSKRKHSLLASTQEEQETLELFSPCKINLFLRIIRKREDGFHDLASLFQAIGFGDTLELTPLAEANTEGSDEFTCNMPGVPVDSTNLVLRALALMREKTGVDMYFKTNLIKQVPAQAGLGGGSANAATAMWGANELMGRPASLEQVSVCVCRTMLTKCLTIKQKYCFILSPIYYLVAVFYLCREIADKFQQYPR